MLARLTACKAQLQNLEAPGREQRWEDKYSARKIEIRPEVPKCTKVSGVPGSRVYPGPGRTRVLNVSSPAAVAC